ncbi:hypothetical protein L195_g051018, partial [Trifolium pratense]
MEAERCVTVTLLYQEGQSTPDYRYRDSDDEIVVDEDNATGCKETMYALWDWVYCTKCFGITL